MEMSCSLSSTAEEMKRLLVLNGAFRASDSAILLDIVRVINHLYVCMYVCRYSLNQRREWKRKINSWLSFYRMKSQVGLYKNSVEYTAFHAVGLQVLLAMISAATCDGVNTVHGKLKLVKTR